VIFLISFPFTQLGLLSSTTLINASIFSVSLASSNFILHIVAWMFPVLSSLNSIFHFLNSSTVAAMFAVTVPAFGDGISPFGHRALATVANSLIISGAVINISNSNLPFLISNSKSSYHTMSAPAAFASFCLSSFTNTAIFLLLPVPCGKTVVVLKIWSLYFGFADVLIAISILHPNFE
jgi:hypothetical protein